MNETPYRPVEVLDEDAEKDDLDSVEEKLRRFATAMVKNDGRTAREILQDMRCVT